MSISSTWIFEIKIYDLDIIIKYNVHILRVLPNLHSSLWLSFAQNNSLLYSGLLRVRLKLPNYEVLFKDFKCTSGQFV